MIKLSARHENWRLREEFATSHGPKNSVNLVVVDLNENGVSGHGEAVPYPRYEQSVEQTLDAISDVTRDIQNGVTRDELRKLIPANAARNALDCAMWDLEGKQRELPVWRLAGLPQPKSVTGVYTLSLNTPENMAEQARSVRNFPHLKLKLNAAEVIESVQAVRTARPDARLIVDANEAWDIDTLDSVEPKLSDLGVEAIEQPLPAKDDAVLESRNYTIDLCADESFFVAADVQRLTNRYNTFNIKLDKSGGLTEAIDTAKEIEKHGLNIMIGSMMSTSLSLAPAMLLTHNAKIVDLDSPVWLQVDRIGGLQFKDGHFSPAKSTLWG